MKQLRAKARVEAFTLIELLVVVIIIVVLAAMLLPTGPHVGQRALSAACMNNQKQIALALETWATDNRPNISQLESSTNALGTTTDINSLKFPWQVSTNHDGTMELISDGQAASQFQVPLDILKSPQVFICPSDKVKLCAPDAYAMGNSNISYFVNVVSSPSLPAMGAILTGDRHLQVNGDPVKAGLFVYTKGIAMGWTRELHPTLRAGNLSFTDGHVECVPMASSALTTMFNRQNLANARLLVP